MDLPLYQIDAFTDRAFAGNPAAVMPLESWLPDGLMQQIAAENNLSETAFFVPKGDQFHIRWFTPTVEIDLCGHATLAAGHVITKLLQPGRGSVTFDSRSGELKVTRAGDKLQLDFPVLPVEPANDRLDAVAACFDLPPVEVFKNDSYIAYLAVFEDERTVRSLTPNFLAFGKLDKDVIVTARGDAVDFVSRFFAPNHGIPEDPVTGSAHCLLMHFWAGRLGKTTFHARQVSSRGGDLWVELKGDRVLMAGHSVCVLTGTMSI